MICVQEKENGGAETFTALLFFIAQKDKNLMAKCKLCPGQKQLCYNANKASALCRHLHKQL